MSGSVIAKKGRKDAAAGEVGELDRARCELKALRRQVEQFQNEYHDLRLMQHSIEHSHNAIIWVDADGVMHYVNNQCCRQLGYSREELLNLSIFDIDRKLSSETWYERWLALKAEGELLHESLYQDKKGRIFPVEVRNNFMVYGQDELNCLSLRDISQQKRSEEEKSKMETLLRQAQKMEAIGTLAGGIAHDFNNLLQAILMFSDIAKANVSGKGKARHCLEQLTKAAERASDLVQQILAFSRQTEQETRPLLLQPIIQEALSLIKGSLPSTIEIKTHIDPKCGFVVADASQIHQIVMNLCTNAYHAMREQGGMLDLCYREADMDENFIKNHPNLVLKGYARLSVSDTGCGMESAMLERIFEPFYTTKDPGEGTGLGLSMVHGIVKAYHGEIMVESTPGQGTCFDIFLPLCTQTEYKASNKRFKRIPVNGDEKVLFVDDEELIAEVVDMGLTTLGYRMTVCNNSINALNAFQKEAGEYDIVITDQTMPELTGIQLAHEILLIRPDVPILLCTGYGEIHYMEQARAVGIHKCLKKPLLVEDLAHAIRDVMDAKA